MAAFEILSTYEARWFIPRLDRILRLRNLVAINYVEKENTSNIDVIMTLNLKEVLRALNPFLYIEIYRREVLHAYSQCVIDVRSRERFINFETVLRGC